MTNPLLTDWDDRTIAVIGLGYVGLPLAVEFGKKRKVRGSVISESRIQELQGTSDYTLTNRFLRRKTGEDDALKAEIESLETGVYTNAR